MREIWIPKQTGTAFAVKNGDRITVIDVEGEQVADLFAVEAGKESHFFSTAVTMEVKRGIQISTGDLMYSNQFQPMFAIVEDDVKCHDLLIPCCRKEGYAFYGQGNEHPSCLENIILHFVTLEFGHFRRLPE